MCRIAAYFGPPVRLSALLTEPTHSLRTQSYAPREMTSGLLNADGWGVGWFAPELGPRPGVLRGVQPIWSDENAESAPHAIASRSILAVVRGATPGLGVSPANTPPFAWDGVLLAHNGRFWPWPGAPARALREQLAPEAEAALRGTTDTELLGALWHTTRLRHPEGDPAEALRHTLRTCADLAEDHGGGLSANVVLARADGLIAARFARPGPAPSLYHRMGPTGGIILASEPLDDASSWSAVPPASLVRVDPGGLRVEPLD